LPKRGDNQRYRFAGFTWPRFTQVPNETFAELMPRLSGAAFKVLMAIAHKVLYHGREEGYAPVGYAEIIELTGLHKDSVRRAVKECLDIGCITVLEDYDASRCLSRLYGLKFAPGYGPQSTRRVDDGPTPDRRPDAAPRRSPANGEPIPSHDDDEPLDHEPHQADNADEMPTYDA
jgi:hypothetical protein